MTELNPNILIQDITGEINLYAPIDIIDTDTGELISSGTSKLSRINPDGLGLFNNLIDSTRLSGVILNAVGFAYDNLASIRAITWDNITTKIEAIQALSQASNTTTLNVNNSISIQYGETTSSPTQKIVISADATGNRLALNNDYGTAGLVLTSGGDDGNLYWGSNTEPGTTGTLADVLTNSNVANMAIDMNGFNLENIGEIQMNADPIPLSELTITRMAVPITMNGVVYYIPLYSNP